MRPPAEGLASCFPRSLLPSVEWERQRSGERAWALGRGRKRAGQLDVPPPTLPWPDAAWENCLCACQGLVLGA